MLVGIIGAMEEEVFELRTLMKNLKTITKGSITLYSGELNNIDVVLILCGIGKVAASVGTTLLIERFSPDIIINTGSAGGLMPDLNIGDVIISTEIRYHDVDVTLFGYDYGQLPKMPSKFTPDPQLVDMAKKAASRINNIQIKEGLIVSGDSFIHTENSVNFIKEKFIRIEATEMEAGGIAQVCYMFNTPFLIIRSISDVPGKKSKESFKGFLTLASKNSSRLVLEILNELLGDK